MWTGSLAAMRAHLAPVALLACFLLGPRPATAETSGQSPAELAYELPDYIRDAPALPTELGLGEALPLPLRDAVLMAIEGNLGLRLERERRADRAWALVASHGSFEPRLWLAYDHSNSRTPPTSSVDGAADDLFLTDSDSVQVGLSQALPTATEVGVSFSSANTSSALGTAVEPQVVRNYLGVTLRQPLLKGFAFDIRVPRASVLRAKMNSKQAALEMQVRAAATVRATEDRYWDLVLAIKGWELQAGTLRLAEEQLELTRRQIETGILPPSDLIQAESTLARRQLAMERAAAAIGTAEDRLRVVLGPADDGWKTVVLPTSAPLFDPSLPEMDAAIDAARERRPELAQSQTELDQASLAIAVATNEMLPELDLDVGLGVVGQDSTGDAAMQKLGTFEARAWSAGVAFSWTPALRASLGELRQAQGSRRAASTRLRQAQIDVEVEVRAAQRELETAGRQVHAAARFRDLAERSLDVEQRRFLDGISSNFLVAQRQDLLAQARLAELTALIAHRKARTAWEQATGQLLDMRSIVVDG